MDAALEPVLRLQFTAVFFKILKYLYVSKTRRPKTAAKLIQNYVYCFFITIFRLVIPAFFRFTDVTELM